MNKSKPIQDFIEEIEDYVHESHNYERGFKFIVQRKDFGKQPLKLGDFIACDLDGNPLEKPKPINYSIDVSVGTIDEEAYKEATKQYQEALDRVIFQGCYVIEQRNYHIIKTNNHELVWLSWDDSKTIEDLVHLGLTLNKSIN